MSNNRVFVDLREKSTARNLDVLYRADGGEAEGVFSCIYCIAL